MTAAHLLGRFKAADDRSLQANDVNGILDVVASEKQVVDLCFRSGPHFQLPTSLMKSSRPTFRSIQDAP